MEFSRICRCVLIFLVFTISFYSINSADEETFKIISPSYFSEQNNEFETINYIDEEYLSFSICSDNDLKNKKFELVCNSNLKKELEINPDKREEGCFYNNFELQYAPCDDFTLEVSYESDNVEKKITRTFEKQKLSRLLNHILGLDYESLTPAQTSNYLVVLNEILPISDKRSIDIYEKLKTDRNNENKCWPTETCSINVTSEILRNVKLATYSSNTRLLEDGKTYLEKNMISNTNNPSSFIIKITDDLTSKEVSCALGIDGDTAKTYIFNNATSTVQKYASEKIIFTCNQSLSGIEFLLSNLNNKTQDFEKYLNTNTFTFNIDEFGCIGEDASCDFDSTINTLLAYGSTLDDSTLLDSYIDTLIIEDPTETYLDTDNVYEDIGKVLYYEKNEGLLEYLKFNQNNDGSWGEGSRSDKIEETSWAILGLKKSSATEEYIEDGEKWIYFNEPIEGWASLEKNTLAYLAIKENIKPFLKITPKNIIKEKETFEITNPTIHNIKKLQLSFSDEIKDYLSYTEDLGEILSEEEIRVEVEVDENFYGQLTGDLILTGLDSKNNEIEFAKIPISIVGQSPFKLITGKYSSSSELPIVPIKIEKQIPTFTSECQYTNPFDDSIAKATLTQDSKTLDLKNTALKNGNFTLNIDCSFDSNSFSQTINFEVTIAEKTFDIDVSEVLIDSLNDFSIKITSTETNKQTIQISVDGNFEDLIEPAESSKIIAGKDTRDIFFKITNPVFLEALGNAGKGNVIITSDTGYSKLIPIKLNMGETGQIEASSNSNLKWYIGITLLLLIIISLVLYRYYQLNKSEEKNEGYGEEEYYIE